MVYFVLICVEWLWGRIHSIICSEQFGVALSRNTRHTLLWSVWNCCDQGYMAYFVAKRVEWLLVGIHGIFLLRTLWSGFDEEFMAYFLVKCVEWLWIRIYGIFCSEQCGGAVRCIHGVFFDEVCGASVSRNTWNFLLWALYIGCE